jgi:hypothetical protein
MRQRRIVMRLQGRPVPRVRRRDRMRPYAWLHAADPLPSVGDAAPGPGQGAPPTVWCTAEGRAP